MVTPIDQFDSVEFMLGGKKVKRVDITGSNLRCDCCCSLVLLLSLSNLMQTGMEKDIPVSNPGSGPTHRWVSISLIGDSSF